MIDHSVTLFGNLVKPPEKLQSSYGAGAKFRIAQNERRRDATGEWKDGPTLFMDVVCWRSLAVHVLETIGKGDPVVVMGRLRDASWTDDAKVVHYKIEVEAELVALDLRRGVTGRFRKLEQTGTPPADPSAPAPVEGAGLAGGGGVARSGGFDHGDPFAEAGEGDSVADDILDRALGEAASLQAAPF